MTRLTPLYLAVLAFALIASGCRTDDGGGDGTGSADAAVDARSNIDSGAGLDAAPEVGCDPYRPRTEPTSVFIGPDGLENRLLADIASAESELLVMMYVITLTSFVDALIAAQVRGVDVRVLLDGDHGGNIDSRAMLQAGGVEVRDAPASFEHAHSKMFLIDGHSLVLMSSNLTFASMDDERNYGVVIRDPEDIFDARAIFESDWTDEGYPDLACTRLLVSPINSRARLLQHINRADNKLELEVLYLSDNAITTAVLERQQAGAEVRVLLNDDPDNADTAAHLTQGGIEVRMLRNPSVHAKLIIADGIPFVGSQNLSYTAINENRELGAMVLDSAGRQTIVDRFESDWQNGDAL